MGNHFVINVAIDGKHLFATAPHSFSDTTEDGLARVRSVALALIKAFPTASVTIAEWTGYGISVPVNG